MNIYGNSVGHPLPDPRKGMEMSGPINMNGQSLKGLNAPTEDGDAVNLGFVKNMGKAKAGFIYPLASAVVPDGFLLCDGAAYARSEYPELFAAIGTMYGSGDGATTFNVPDLRNRVPAGSSDNHPAGEMVGEETHKLTVDEMPSHMHKLANPVGYGSGDSIGYAWSTTIPNYGNMETQYVGGDQPHNNMQPTTFIHGYIIATGKGTGVSVADIILGAQALPLGLEYGGVGATDPKTARENLEVAQAIESTEHPGCYYRMVDGEKEWLNPPCLFGVDYRTADRNNGNPVYTKVINLGVLSADKEVDPNLPSADYKVFDLTIYVAGRVSPTGWTGSSWDFTAYYSDGTIKIRSGSSFYGVRYNGYAQIWFCKGID